MQTIKNWPVYDTEDRLLFTIKTGDTGTIENAAAKLTMRHPELKYFAYIGKPVLLPAFFFSPGRLRTDKQRWSFEHDNNFSAYWKTEQPTGLNHLDAARQFTDTPNLHPKRVKGTILQTRSSAPEIEISEKIARDSGHFSETSNVKVIVFTDALNPFLELKHTITKNDETGEIEEVRFFWELNESKVIDWWADLGYPLEIEVAK